MKTILTLLAISKTPTRRLLRPISPEQFADLDKGLSLYTTLKGRVLEIHRVS